VEVKYHARGKNTFTSAPQKNSPWEKWGGTEMSGKSEGEKNAGGNVRSRIEKGKKVLEKLREGLW